jgi:hypothetical protein
MACKKSPYQTKPYRSYPTLNSKYYFKLLHPLRDRNSLYEYIKVLLKTDEEAQKIDLKDCLSKTAGSYGAVKAYVDAGMGMLSQAH